MRATITINMDNESFGGLPEYELARILKDLSNKVEHGIMDGFEGLALRDANGNRVGTFTIA